MKIRWLVLIALMIAMGGSAYAQSVVYHDARDGVYGYDRARMWNPLTGYRPWLEPQGYAVPYGYDSPGRRVIVERSVPYRSRWRHRYTHDLNLGGYPAGYPSYQYKFYNP